MKEKPMKINDKLFITEVFANDGKAAKKGKVKPKKMRLRAPEDQAKFQEEVYSNLTRNIS